MSDAREIIAQTIEPFVHHADDVTSVVISALDVAGCRILGPDEVEDVRRIVEIANRNEWSAEGDRLARALGRKA